MRAEYPLSSIMPLFSVPSELLEEPAIYTSEPILIFEVAIEDIKVEEQGEKSA